MFVDYGRKASSEIVPGPAPSRFGVSGEAPTFVYAGHAVKGRLLIVCLVLVNIKKY